MGLVFTRLFSSLFGNKEARILVLGLDNAGKTTILCMLHSNLFPSSQFPRVFMCFCNCYWCFIVCLDRLQMGEVVSIIPSWYSFSAVYFKSTFCWVWMMDFIEFQIRLKFCIVTSDAAIGFNVETVQYNNIKFQVWDLAILVCLIT